MKSTLEYFEEIMKIPRESGKEDKIANYLINYAKENNIEYNLGKYNTVFLKKDNNSYYFTDTFRYGLCINR